MAGEGKKRREKKRGREQDKEAGVSTQTLRASVDHMPHGPPTALHTRMPGDPGLL